jgi:hypothetical protein
MRHPGRRAGLLLAASVTAIAGAAEASETVTYTYDALGRLTATTSSGNVNNGVATSLGYDPAGNRSSYAVTGVGGAPPPPSPPPPSPPPPPPPSPPPPPPPPPANHPPIAADDSGAQPKCTTRTYAVLQNDSDPDGDPLTLVSVTGTGFSIVSDTVQFTSLASIGAKSGTYTVRDSHNATATATLTVTVSGGTCPQSAPVAPPPPPPSGRGGGQ